MFREWGVYCGSIVGREMVLTTRLPPEGISSPREKNPLLKPFLHNFNRVAFVYTISIEYSIEH